MTKKDRKLGNVLKNIDLSGKGGPASKTAGETPASAPETPPPVPRRVVPPSEQADFMRRGERQTYSLYLPVSKRSVPCTHMLLDPEKCVVAPFNRRVQSLLSADDPNMESLIDSLRGDGQREPVLARPIRDTKNGDVVRHEIVWGSRRRFAAEVLNAELADKGGMPLRAWVSSEIPDVDAARLSRTENADREGISPWEMSVSLSKVQEENPTWTHDVIAANEGVERTSVGRYLALSTLPETLVKMVASPQELSLRSGLGLVKIWDTLDPALRDKVKVAISDKVPFPNGKALEKAIVDYLKFVREKQVKVPTRGKVVLSSPNGNVSVSIGKHRHRNGAYTADFEGVTDDQMEALKAAFQKILSVKSQ